MANEYINDDSLGSLPDVTTQEVYYTQDQMEFARVKDVNEQQKKTNHSYYTTENELYDSNKNKFVRFGELIPPEEVDWVYGNGNIVEGEYDEEHCEMFSLFLWEDCDKMLPNSNPTNWSKYVESKNKNYKSSDYYKFPNEVKYYFVPKYCLDMYERENSDPKEDDYSIHINVEYSNEQCRTYSKWTIVDSSIGKDNWQDVFGTFEGIQIPDHNVSTTQEVYGFSADVLKCFTLRNGKQPLKKEEQYYVFTAKQSLIGETIEVEIYLISSNSYTIRFN